jgi:CheY-like chemotaxis protein
MARVLLVDDEPLLRDALKQFLEFSGHTVDEAADGDEALARLVVMRPDVVVSDVLMPTRDGMSLCRHLRRDPALADIPFVFITARNAQTDLRAEMERLGDGWVTKPFEPDDLLAMVEGVVAKGR